MLSIHDHSRKSPLSDSQATYVYTVLSRRSGGVSLGINLNPNNACNWACIYCQVPGLRRGGPPPVDLARLEEELRASLAAMQAGDFLRRESPAEAQVLKDVAFSGNGEPTSAAEFPGAVAAARRVMEESGLLPRVPLRLITNGSFLHRATVCDGISRLAAAGGEVWFKLDRATRAGMSAVNCVRGSPETVERKLRTCCALAPTWIQSCWFAVDGKAPDIEEENAYVDFLAGVRDKLSEAQKIRGVHLYGLARPSFQDKAGRLSALPAETLENFAQRLRDIGFDVVVNP
ncbi:MAG: radical SAM protein [Betaproteobacteria bacterium]|nr:radical SAM protein [Betaproteobacteria bacterium]